LQTQATVREPLGLLTMLVALLLNTALLAACIAAPLALAIWVHPLVGCLGFLASAWLWTKLVRPGPGFVQGIICLNGLAWIVGSFCVWLVRACFEFARSITRFQPVVEPR
jgi:hypothetical protein